MDVQQPSEQQLKLLSFATNADLKKALGTQTYYTMLATAEVQKGSRPTLKDIKTVIKTSPQYLFPVVQNQELQQKYVQAQQKKMSPEGLQKKADLKKLNATMSAPKKQYKGCLATKIKPEDYESCLIDYDNPQQHYEKYSSLVPYNAIRQNKAVSRQDQAAAKILALSPETTIRDLPLGPTLKILTIICKKLKLRQNI